MASKLEQLRSMTTVVADTGDVEAVRALRPVDCTTNPTIVLKALGTPGFRPAIEEAVDWAARTGLAGDVAVRSVADRLAVSVGCALTALVPGRVSTEVDADLSFNSDGAVAQARRIIDDYAARGVGRERVLVKLAATWEGIRAAEALQKQGIDCNLTLVFSMTQAVACADAGVFLISPFVGRIMDWHAKASGRTFGPEEDPGVLSVRAIYDYYKSNGIRTVVMGASFRNTGEIEALAGCDRLTIAPPLLAELSAAEGPLPRRLAPEGASGVAPVAMDERRFRWEMNQDAMATEKLAEGIRLFARDLDALRDMVRRHLEGAPTSRAA